MSSSSRPTASPASRSPIAATGIEAIILDVGLPDISGLEVARRVRATGSDVAILMLTARDTVGDRVTGLDAGADDYLVKPFAYEELAARLRALGRRGGNGAASGAEARGRADHARRDLAPGDPRRQADRPQPARVLAARVLPAPSRPDAVARPAARPGLAVQRGRDAERGRRLHPLPAREARRGRATDRDRPRRRAIAWPMPDGDLTPSEATAPGTCRRRGRRGPRPACPAQPRAVERRDDALVLVVLARVAVRRRRAVARRARGWPSSMPRDQAAITGQPPDTDDLHAVRLHLRRRADRARSR